MTDFFDELQQQYLPVSKKKKTTSSPSKKTKSPGKKGKG